MGRRRFAVSRNLPGVRPPTRTNIRRLWREQTRLMTRCNAWSGPRVNARNAMAFRLRRLNAQQGERMRPLWTPGRQPDFYRAYRRAVHTTCLIAGLHLAIQRRARRPEVPA